MTLAPTNGATSPTTAGTTISTDSTFAPTVTTTTRFTAAPTTSTEAPLATRETTITPTPAPNEAPVSLAPTPAPTVITTAPTAAPTPAPTAPPTFSSTSYCERPHTGSNEGSSGLPCVELTTLQDRENGVGAFYDEEDCGQNASVVGCFFGGVDNCRVCVYNRKLYSDNILDGEDVPFVDCPCCVPDVYEKGGDIDCIFTHSTAPISGPIPSSSTNEVMLSLIVPLTVIVPSSSSSSSLLSLFVVVVVVVVVVVCGVVIETEPCETGAGGDTSGEEMVCVDIASSIDRDNGIGTFYERNCEGVGCSIAGFSDCRQCIFDNASYEASGAKNMGLVSCPCCVPISYMLRPEETECDWPPTPSP
ncbi:unnamed protein product, partial [Pylaiella littoralis]